MLNKQSSLLLLHVVLCCVVLCCKHGFSQDTHFVLLFKFIHGKFSFALVPGYVEPAHLSDFTFETQRRTFTSYGEYLSKFLSILLFNCIVLTEGWRIK